MEQWGMVGVKKIYTRSLFLIYIRSTLTTLSCSRLKGYSGSLMWRMSSKISSSSYGSQTQSSSSRSSLYFFWNVVSWKASYSLGYGFYLLMLWLIVGKILQLLKIASLMKIEFGRERRQMIRVSYIYYYFCINIKVKYCFYNYFDMLRRIGTLPPEAQGCFHDNLTGITYTSVQGKLHKCDPKQGNSPVPLSFWTAQSYAAPETYLHRLIKVQGQPVLNTQCTIATNKTTGICVVRSTRSLSDRSSWQFHVPGSLHGIELGLVNVSSNGSLKYLPFTFNSSTFDNSTVKAWVNESAFSKKNCKNVEWDLSDCYPYAKLTTQGSTVVFNPFSTQPNSKISRNNPFCIWSGKPQQPLKTPSVQQPKIPNQFQILDVKQISKDKLLLVGQDNHIKIITRNSLTNRIQFNSFSIHDNLVYNLFTNEEWARVTTVKPLSELAAINWQDQGYLFDEVFELLRGLIIRVDQSQEIKQSQAYNEISYLLLEKLAILRPYAHTKIPNSIYNCEIDRAQHHYSQEYFKSHNSTPVKTIPAFVVSNRSGWLKLDGSFIEATQHYIASLKRVESNSKQYEVSIYHHNDFGVKKVFTRTCGDQVQFSKSQSLEGFSDIQTNLWKQNAQASEIYKILSNCFTNPAGLDNNVYQFKEKDVTELVDIFKTSKQDAVTALEQTGNIEDALAWLADPNHKLLRKKKVEGECEDNKLLGLSKISCSILELPTTHLISKLLLQVDNSIYLIGFDPRTLGQKYVQKTQKGFMNLSNFQYGTVLTEINGSFINQGLNHSALTLLEKLSINVQENQKNSIVSLFRDSKGIYLAFRGENQSLLRSQIEFNQENAYREASALKISADGTQLYSGQEIGNKQINKNIQGQLILQHQKALGSAYQPFTVASFGQEIFANYQSVQVDELFKAVDVWVKFNKHPQLQFNEQEEPTTPKYIPLLVEHGPPGCNLNYPICSILYPKAPLPFLANYPYSLTFRHLHSKCMKVTEVVIQRIGEKHNVNEIKQGCIYFADDANIQSERYKFRFDNKNQLTVEIKENCYWKYMIIQPSYHHGSKMPYEIGFMGAKGTSIELDEYEQLLRNKIEQNLQVCDKNGKCRFELTQISPLSESTYKATLQYTSNNLTQIQISSKQPSMSIQMFQLRVQNKCQGQQKEKESSSIKTSSIVSMSSTEIISHLTKSVSKPKDRKLSTTAVILREISKNDGISLGEDYNQTQIKILIDLFLGSEELSLKDYEALFDKIKSQSKAGQRYLQQIIHDIGKGYVYIPPQPLQSLLTKSITKQSPKLGQQIVHNLLSQIPTIRNEHYHKLQKQHNNAYLMLETDYYSKFYYNQIQEVLQCSSTSQHCDPIYREEVLDGYQFVAIKDSKYRKFILKFHHKSSIRNLLLRFDKSEVYNKGYINVYVHTQKGKQQCARALLQEHQWIQITKNPYRQEMVNMFGSNHTWLNAYGVQLDSRVEASYLEIEVMFNTSGICAKELNSSNVIEIMPEIYGEQVGPAQPIAHLEQTYFNVHQDQKIFLSKLPLKLQIQSESTSSKSHLFNKYLINKQNIPEYQLYESSQKSTTESKLQKDEQAQQFLTDLRHFANSNENDRKVQDKRNGELLERYHRVMKGLDQGGSHVRVSKRVCLDFCYTLLMWVLDIMAKKGIPITEKTGKELLDKIIKVEIGPVTFSCLKSISKYPNLLLESLNYIKITGEDDKNSLNSISTSFIRGNNEININSSNIKATLESNDPKLAESLINIIIDTKEPSEETIHQCIELVQITHNHQKVIKYILGKHHEHKQQMKQGTSHRYLFNDPSQKHLFKQVLHYIYGKGVSESIRNDLFLSNLNSKQIESLILQIRRLNHHKQVPEIQADSNYLLTRLFSNKQIDSVSLDIVSLIFEVELTVDQKWDYLEKCIKYCHAAEDMIHCQYLSASRDQKDELIQLVVFHRDILLSAAKCEKNSELLANFLAEVYHCHRRLFIEVVMYLPEGEGEVYPLHPDIYSLIISILEQNCNLGGIDGTKLCTLQQSYWLSCMVKLLKLATTKLLPQSLSTSEIDSILKWYLLNNEYEAYLSNPINRSQSINNIKTIAEYVSEIIKKIGGARNINKIFNIYTEIKQDIKKDNKRLISSKSLILNRLQYGVFKLIESSVEVGNLTDVLVGSSQSKGLAEEIINQLQEEKNSSTKQVKAQSKQVDLTEQIETYSIQGTNLINLQCKDLQSYKTGSKSFVTKVLASAKKFYLRSPTLMHINKFIIGFNVQDTPDKNNILPDSVELFGGRVGDGELTTAPSGMKKIVDLEAIDDQNYTQFGVKLFAANFDCIRRQYRNSGFNILQVRMKTLSQPSVSDLLQSNQKITKNAVYHISFVAINGRKQQVETQLSFSNIYMKLLTFLSNPDYEQALKAFIKHMETHKGSMNKLVELLSAKTQRKEAEGQLEKLLIAFSKHGVPVLSFLLKQPTINQQLVNKILKSNLSSQNIDLVLGNILSHQLNEQSISNITENIKLASYNPSTKHSKIKNTHLLQICRLYEKQVHKSQEAAVYREEAKFVRKLLACITTTPEIFQFNAVQLIQKLMDNTQHGTLFYPIVAAFVTNSNQALDWFLSSGKLNQISVDLLREMQVYKKDKNKKTEHHISHIICLLSALSIYPPIRQRLIQNPQNSEVTRLPLKIFDLLTTEQTLIEQYPVTILKKFVNFFQSTCTSNNGQSSTCSEQFASKLIEVMVRLPEVSSIYHNYFIHQFFFHLINAYNGVLVNFVWKGLGKQYYSRPTEILRTHPIRKNDTIREYQGEFYRLVNSNEELVSETKKIVVFNNNVVAERAQKWNVFQLDQVDHQIIEISPGQKSLKLNLKANATKELTFNSTDPYKVFVQDSQIRTELLKLLTNQTLLRINNPSIFFKKYSSSLPVTEGMLPYVYLLPAEITVAEMLKEINLCGYLLQSETRDNIQIRLYGHEGEKVKQEEKIGDIFNRVKHRKPLIQLELSCHDLFKNTTIEKISTQSSESSTTKFIAQETIFKSFQKQKGLQKMIKVIMACVKNWANQEQSKIWTQYLSELSSFSCFPIFSSIYMNKSENVELLFNLLSGLPDKEDNKKWLGEEKKSVRFLYDIIKNVFEVEGEQAITVRKYAVDSGFYETMLERLHIVTKQPKRVKKTEADEESEAEVTAPMELVKKTSEQEYKKQIKKKKGIGYGNDSSSNQKWDIAGHQSAKKQLSDQRIGLIKILQKFLSHPKFKVPAEYLQSTYSSAILPILEASLRAGSLLQISKNAQLFKQELRFIRTLARNESLVPALMQIPKCFEPKQLESIFSLLTTLEGISKIFINCLTGSVSEKTSEEIAKDIIETFNQVEEAIEHYKSDHVDEEADKKILQLPLTKKYPILMKDLRFDYIDMKDKNGKMKHHYSSSYQAKHSPPPTKTIRLAQELADISQALPIEHTNAIFVRCDKDRVDFMQALIMGSNGTPYGHGAYLFDIYFDDSYPNNPPKVNLTTTGSGAIRFNPNLYACGKVCLSLLGTWRGSAMENWDAKVSTLLQVLVSIQSIIMAEEIYFNEPGFEHEQGTVEGQKKNQAYSNIVRYGNIKFAMIENIKNPPKGFETIIRRHFYLKKAEIMEECKKWLKFAEKRQASYTGLVSDHNNNWSNTFKKSKTEYKTMLEKAINELEVELNKLPEPSAKDLIKQSKPKKEKKQKKEVKVEKDENLEEIDVTYDTKNVNEQGTKIKELDINDEKVKDRWSRYIGAMGLEAVSKQSKASILMFGLAGLGIEIAKNIVLSGCKRFTVCDDQVAEWKDLSGQFYLTEDEIGKGRVESCLYKLQDLNSYVRVDSTKIDLTKLQQENILKQYQVVITTVHNDKEITLLDNYCRKNGIKFIAVKCEGPYGYVFNDFGQKFEVLDKNGEQAVECFIENITNEEKGVVTLMKGQKHPYEDGDEVKITKVKGMDSKTEEGNSINDTIHKISIINQSSFRIGDTSGYTEYAGNGLVKNMKVATRIDFKPYEQCLPLLNIDSNLAYYDFAKSTNNQILHQCFRVLSQFKEEHKGSNPRPWNWQDAEQFYQLYVKTYKTGEQVQIPESEKAYVYKFGFTCEGSFAPLAAFYGGLIAQEAFKAITSKYMPINQFFLTDFTEIVDDLPKEFSQWKEFVSAKNYKAQNDRFEGLRSIVGEQLLQKIRECKVFVIGSGAIGCELLKNYAMVNLATSEKPNKGSIVVTDPDHIETSNLNRQFLFRQKHLQKPKSATAAAVVKQMNRYLKGENKIRAKLIKVCEATKDTFSNEFFESMDIVTNALDNVQARQYVDLRCVENKVALLESGTLSTKGHVQVIVPYKTETYGSKADPAEEGDIPHCTLKMFPEETLHCVEWARDIFGKTFTMRPKALMKILEGIATYTPTESETSVLKDCLEMLKQKPTNFDDAVYAATKEFYKFYRNDIKQLLYTYPLDAKTKDGKDFWKLPKRPPSPIEQISQQSKLQGDFIISYAVLLCKIFNVPYPKDFRTQERKTEVLKQASKIKVDPFVPSDKLAKQMATEVQENKADKKKQEGEQEIKQKEEGDSSMGYVELFKQIKLIIGQEKEQGNELKITAEEFEKDDDANGHIDLIYSMANLRASNYKLDPMDWITTKLKAGRITPALSTTTSCIAALQTIELIKYLKKLPIDQMKNTFLNLAVPIIQAGEPGEVQKIKIHSELTTNIWERWNIDQININQITVRELFEQIEQKYKIQIKTVNIAGGGPIYSDLVLGLESKKQQKEQFLNRKFKDVVAEQVSAEEAKNYIDLTLVMAVGGQFIEHVPTLRVNYKK